MSMEDENKELHKLVNINQDACNFYDQAADETNNMQLKQTFRSLKSLHNSVIVDLQQCIRENGGDPEADETFVGQTAQFWGKLMSKISNDVDETLVNHLEEAEDRCLHSIEDALQKDSITASTKNLLQNELIALQQSHDHMKALKESMRA